MFDGSIPNTVDAVIGKREDLVYAKRTAVKAALLGASCMRPTANAVSISATNVVVWVAFYVTVMV
jgi:hypothetical protein